MMIRTLVLSSLSGALLGASALAQTRSVEPDAPVRPKPAHVTLDAHQRLDRIRVKFRDGLLVRARGGQLTDLGSGSLDAARATLQQFAGGTWVRAFTLDETRLDRLRATARQRLARHVADLNLQFDFVLPEGVRADDAIDAFNALESVEIADASPLPPPAPTPPDFTAQEIHMQTAPKGSSAQPAWAFSAGIGTGIRVCDVEYSYSRTHLDLPPVTELGPPYVDPSGSNPQHGTAVIGAMGALDNGYGVTGMSYGATYYFAAANTANGYHVDAAIIAGVGALSAGDVMTLEQQAFGPGNFLVPVEWDVTVYNAIQIAVGNGIVVVEAGANHGRNLDDPIYSTGNGGHWPFLPQNDSGAIIVGAGATVLGIDGDRSRLTFSSYGSTVDLQGWGEHVTTAGFGALYSAEGPDQYYTNAFNGTSSAVPIVASACIDVQAVHKARTGTVLTSLQLRDLLRATGSPQTSGTFPASQNIGPRPDVTAAIQMLGDASAVTLCAGDARATACPCGNDAAANSGRGCLNSFGLGAALVATGTPSLSNDSFRLVSSSIGPNASMLFFQGAASGNGAVFGDGLRCATGSVIRLGSTAASTSGDAAYPSGAQTPVSVRGQISVPGQRTYQVWYRNAAAFCSADPFNLTNSVSAQWAP
jgi:serine protease